MSVFLDTTRSALREISPSLNRTISTVGPTLAHSWRFWPVLIYAIHRFLKKKHQKVATNVGAFLWMAYLSKKRSTEGPKINTP
mmetsp:Transcript_4441/g.5313  ORF Transcript_4441/g.5313 Transcript_4441/m.5313 type:complete len:83 (-) Transcript_4441:156-404(-)